MPDSPETPFLPPHPGIATAVATPSYVPPCSGPAPVFTAATDRYVLGEEIARGGMGAVHRATDTAFGREVAVKFLLPGHDPGRFFDEARITGQLQHPGIPPIYDLGTLPDGRPFLAMKLIKGKTLEALLKVGETLNVPAVFEGICQALGYAHAHQVIHRDLKPSNVMVGAHGEVQVMDWGLAKVLSADPSVSPSEADTGAGTAIRTNRDAADATRAGSTMGTPAYMPPEQARGTVAEIDAQSDVFGLGGILCAMLTGRPVYVSGNHHDTEMMAANAETAAAFERLDGSGSDPELVALCKRCLSAKKGDRPVDGNAVADEVAAMRAAADARVKQAELDRVRADEEGKRQRQRLSAERSRQQLLIGAATVMLAATGVSVWQAVRAHDEAERANGETKRADDRAKDAQREQVEAERQKGLANEATGRANVEAKRADDRAAEAEREKKVAKESELYTRRMVGRMAVAEGLRLAETGDVTRALAWFARPLQVAPEAAADDLVADRLIGHLRYSNVPCLVGLAGEPINLSRPGWQIPSQLRVIYDDDRKFWAVYVWDAGTDQPLTPPLPHADRISSAMFSPDRRWLATACHGGTARVWDVATGRPVTPPLPHAAADSPKSGGQGGGGGGGGSRSGGRRPRPPHASDVYAVSLHKGQRGDGQPRILPPARATQVEFSADGRRLTVTSYEGKIRVWDIATGRPNTSLLRKADRVQSVVFSPDGRLIATADSDGTARVWDATTGLPVTPPLQHAVQEGLRDLVNGWSSTSLTFSPDGRRLVTTCGRRYDINVKSMTARVWDVVTGSPITPPLKDSTGILSNASSPDGRRVMTVSYDGKVRVWDAVTGQHVIHDLLHSREIYLAVFSPDGRRVVTASNDRTVRVWEVATGRPITPPLENAKGVFTASFSPDGRRLATVSRDKSVWVWDAITGQPVTLPLKHTDEGVSAVFSPDGRRLATISRDCASRVWDVATGRPVTPPLKHTNEIYLAVFSPDGRRLVTASGDKTARVWDAFTGQPVTPPLPHAAGVISAEFSPDGRRLVTACEDGKARLWELPSDDRPATDLIKFAHLHAGGRIDDGGGFVPLTEDEMKSLLADLRAKYPADFTVTPAQAAAWHREQLDAAEAEKKWFAVAFHLRVLLAKYAFADTDLAARLLAAEAELRKAPAKP